MVKLTIFLYYWTSILICTLIRQSYASSGEVMGCGGFVKSSKSNIDLSRINVGLYEKRGKSLRYVSKTQKCVSTFIISGFF